jgi:hypothetical protein
MDIKAAMNAPLAEEKSNPIPKIIDRPERMVINRFIRMARATSLK